MNGAFLSTVLSPSTSSTYIQHAAVSYTPSTMNIAKNMPRNTESGQNSPDLLYRASGENGTFGLLTYPMEYHILMVERNMEQ